MDSSGFSSPRFECFPAGLRVLVVDDDPTWLKILEKMLKKCNYEVMTCNLAREALSLLRERKDGFDIVISDVNMPDMDGFKLLEHVGLEMDLPVIMMSVDGETSRVMKGVQHGACDYLLKPIRMKELRNIWQHVLRKRMHEVRDIEGHETFTDQSDDYYLFGGDMVTGKKRKDVESKHDDTVRGDPSSVKKNRVVWTVDLHQKFVTAVNQIGLKVGPKKILDLMGVPWLTRENVASHLQKYRLYLSRLQKENELKVAFGGLKQSTVPSPGDTPGNSSIQNSNAHSSVTTNQSISVSGLKNPNKNTDSKTSDENEKGSVSIPVAESKKALFGEVEEDPLKSTTSRISFNPDVKSETKIQAQYIWSEEVSSIQFTHDQKPHFQSRNILRHPPRMDHVDSTAPILSCNALSSGNEVDIPIEAHYGSSRTQGAKVTKVQSIAALFSAQPESSCYTLKQIPCSTSNVKNPSLEQHVFDMESSQRNTILETASTFPQWDDPLNGYPTRGDSNPLTSQLGSIKSSSSSNQEVIADVPPHLRDSLDFYYEIDTWEYPVIGQGLYIA